MGVSINIKINSVSKWRALKIREEKKSIPTSRANSPNVLSRRLKRGCPWGWAAEMPRNTSLDSKTNETVNGKNKDTILYKGINWKVTDNTPEKWTKEDLQEALKLWIDEYFRN